nr:LysE family translocator [Modestobacter marinus]
MSPGPDDVLVLRTAVRDGRRSGTATAVGAATGSLVWGGATALGLAALVARSPGAYDVLRLAGAAYLVGLGLTALLRLPRRDGARCTGAGPGTARRSGLRWAFATGLVSDLLNPRIGLFYLAVLPQFVPAGRSVLPYSLLLCAIDVAVALGWLVLLARLADAGVTWLRRPVVDRWLDRLLSVSLVGLGAGVALGL